MTKEKLKKIATMLDSREKELVSLAINLFWGSNPSLTDYINIQEIRELGTPIPMTLNYFEELKRDRIKNLCGEETYNLIYGKEAIR